jgi:hypothetical protein
MYNIVFQMMLLSLALDMLFAVVVDQFHKSVPSNWVVHRISFVQVEATKKLTFAL